MAKVTIKKSKVETLYIADQIIFNQKIIFNKEETKKINETILFLKIDKDERERYLASLEVKSEMEKKPVVKTIVENQTITIDQNLFQDLHGFAKYRKHRPDARKIGESFNIAEQIQLEKQVGIEIYNTFLPGDIGNIFEDFFSLLMRSKIKQLVLVIGSNIPAVLNIPFELMRKDLESDPFVLANNAFLLTHTIEKGLSDFDIRGVEPLPPPLRMLYVSALPVDLPEDKRLLELEKEQELLIEAVGGLISERKVMVEFLDIATLDEIEKSLSRGEHHIVHFSGHGGHMEEESGVLFLENEDGSTFAVTGEELAKRLKKYKSIKLVALSACETARAETYGVAGALIKNGMPAVLAMRYPVGDRAATCFTSKLYEGICTGKSLCASMFNARGAVLEDEKKKMEELAKTGTLENFISEWMTPFLYLNQNITALIDYSQETTDTGYFFQKPSFRPVEGGKYVGYGFIGRRKEIIRLTSLFRKGKRCVCIYGQGGIGKTTLAIRFADNFENGSYKIIQFRGEVTEGAILKGLAERAKEKLGEGIFSFIDKPDVPAASKLNVLMEQYLSREPVIVLFDNFEDNQVELKGKKIYQREIHSDTLKEFLTHLCNNLKWPSFILFTTRYRFPEPEGEGFNLGEMCFSDSFKLINRFEHLVRLKTGEKWEIHRKLGGHPRALELLDGYFKKEKIVWENVAAGFKDVEEKEINHDLLLDMLWNKLNDTECRVLKAASVFRRRTVFKGLEAVTGLKSDKISNALESLNAFSLAYLEEDTFNIHRLTSTFVTSSKMEESERKNAHIHAAEYYEGLRDDEGNIYLDGAFEARWHYLQAENWNRAAELTGGITVYLKKAGYLRLSLELLAEISETNIGDKNRAKIYHSMGNLYIIIGYYDYALTYYEKSMEIFDKIGDHKEVAVCLHNIGVIYRAKSNYNKALEQHERAMKIREDINNIKGIAGSMCEIGGIYYLKGDYIQAFKQYVKSLELSAGIGDVKGISKTLREIGELYQYKGVFDQALKLYEKVMRIFEKSGDIQEVSDSLHNLGDIYRKQGDYEKAIPKFQKAIEMKMKIKDMKGVSQNLSQIGEIYRLKGDYDQALKMCQKSIEIREKIEDILGTAQELGQLGRLYYEIKNYSEALKPFVKSFLTFTKLGLPYAKPVEEWILKVKQKIPEKQFNEILKEFNLSLEFFEEAEKERAKQLNEFIFNITSQVVNAIEKNEKENVIKRIHDILNQIPEEEPVAAYFHMLLAYMTDEEIDEYKEKVPQEWYQMFEEVREKFRDKG